MIILYFPSYNFPKVNEKGYKRLSPEQSVGLRHAGYVITVQEIIKVLKRTDLNTKA